MKVSVKRILVIKFKEIISKIVLFFLYRGFNIVSKIDDEVEKEVRSWKDGYTIKLEIYDNGPSLILKKVNGSVKKIKETEKTDIDIIFKSLDVAFQVLTGRKGISKAYAEHRFILKGNIIEAMSIVRCLDIVETYLFPEIIAKHLVKSIKKLKKPRVVTYLRVIVNY